LLAAARLDEQHHTGGPACLPHFMRITSNWNGRTTMRFVVRQWLRAFMRVFDEDHGLRIPVGTARLLLRQPARPVRLEGVACLLGCDRRTLERAFGRRYRMTPKVFHQRVRARHAAITLRASDDKVAYVASTCGWSSAANFYAALDRAVGLTPTEIRALPADRFALILEGPLETHPGRLARPADRAR
jgi:AraC-like DNA-binding protein